ncbi:MAG: hypothetical protein HQL56_07625 [Magnetococcales bacterium]|nr:hypothetical protein [Magnetococcales bacterium]
MVAAKRAQPEAIDFVIHRMATYGNSQKEIPRRVTLIRHNPAAPGGDLLYLDQTPVPREAFHYDAHDKTLRWQGLFGGGQLHLSHDGKSAVGAVGSAQSAVSVSGGAVAQFSCDVALNCGASYITDGSKVTGLTWDTSSSDWKNASWVANRLLLTYSVQKTDPILPPTFTFEFADLQTGAIPWDPVLGNFTASLALGSKSGQMVWNLVFKSTIAPDPDKGDACTGPDTVYPWWMQAVEDAAASTINGVLEIDDIAPNGKLVGFQGNRVNPMAQGYYQTSPRMAPFAVFNGKLHVDGQPVANSRMQGGTLFWQDLDSSHQQRLGLPARGMLKFDAHGSRALGSAPLLKATRLSSDNAIKSIAQHNDLHPDLHASLEAQSESLTDSSPTIYGLLAMTPFGQDSSGAWGDQVQEGVRADLQEIMNSFVPSDIWNLLFPGINQPILTGELATVANSPVAGVADPIAWYKSLGTAVMSQGMANGSDSNCQNLNGQRAAAWLKQEVANSAVYQAHSQLLFQYRWGQRYNTMVDYLNDQRDNAATYATQIDAHLQSAITDINTNVIVDASSPANLKSDLIAEATAMADYAKTNQLYWAYVYYLYNTAPAILANIAIQLSISTGSSDGTSLARLFQQNITVLTALDPSGTFAQYYNKTINTFMASNILPTMYGFTGDADDFSLIKEYLQTFVNQNLQSEDAQIAAAANQLQAILGQDDSEAMLKASIEALVSFSNIISDTMALPYVAQKWTTWFKSSYPKLASSAELFGSVLIGGITCLAIFNLFTAYKSWDQLDAGERTELILASTQLGLQILAAVVKRGVRIYAIYGVEGMTFAQRSAAISRILATGEASQLDAGLINISNRTAQWLGDTAGSTAIREEIASLMMIGENDVKAVSWTTRIFGRNLDEFMATRVGPLFILAGIGMSIYFISTGESGVALAADIVNIVSSSLMLFSMVGGWAIEGGIIAAEGIMASIIAIAGPLAIIGALVGLGLMLYEMFKKQPDPVEDFVNDYAKPAGFYVPSKCGAIDYVVSYADANQGNLMMTGFRMGVDDQSLVVASDGSVNWGSATFLPNSVWQVQTDGLGMSRIGTLVQSDPTKGPSAMWLSLMSDNTVSFQPKMGTTTPPSGSPTVRTQTWLTAPAGTASTSGGNLVSVPLTFQPVFPDSKGNYQPSQASGWLIKVSNGLSCSAVSSTPFTVRMSGMAPYYMTMKEMRFALNSTPSTTQRFGASFGVNPSTPLYYANTGTLPPFLSFDGKTGIYAPNGQKATTAATLANTLTASNVLGQLSVNFAITVA